MSLRAICKSPCPPRGKANRHREMNKELAETRVVELQFKEVSAAHTL